MKIKITYQMRQTCILSALYFLTFPGSAEAYLDPGTASLILQGLIGAVAAFAATMGIYWRKVVDFFQGRKKDKDEDK